MSPMSERRRARLDRTEPTMPDPDDPRKPEDPGDLSKRSWIYVLRKTLHEFTEDQCTDLAAALTYYAVLAIFPAMLALVSLLGVIGQAQNAVDKVIETLKPLVSDDMLDRHDRAGAGPDRPVRTRPASRSSSASSLRSGRPPATSAPSDAR